MMILIAIISLGVIGIIGALLLYWASKKFEVHEDPRIATSTGSAAWSQLWRLRISGLRWVCRSLRKS